MSITLTKSLFVEFCDYPKLARRKVHHPDIYKFINKIDSEEAEAHIMAIGQAVEEQVLRYLEMIHNQKALDLMPRYHKVTGEDSDDDDIPLTLSPDLENAIQATLDAIARHEPILYQPTFRYQDCVVRADFMVRNGRGYQLIEAKAKSSIRKKLKDDGEEKAIGAIEHQFIHDISFQSYVIDHALIAAGFEPLQGHYFAYLNKEYIKHGPLDLSKLIILDPVNISSELEITQRNKPVTITRNDLLLNDSEIETKLDQMRSYLSLDEAGANAAFPRSGTRYVDYFGKARTFGTITGPGIHSSNASHIQDLYYAGKSQLSELTEEEIQGFNDSAQHYIARYLEAKNSNKALIDHEKIQEIFSGFEYPICFYDYETISIPIPLMDNTRPYMQTIVQYSLHKYYQDGSMKHYGAVYVGNHRDDLQVIRNSETNVYDSELSDRRDDLLVVRESTPPIHDSEIEYRHYENNPNAVDFEQNCVITGHYSDLLRQMLVDIGEDLHRSTFIVRHEGFENSRNKEVAKLYPDLADAFLTINSRTYDLRKIVSEGYYFDLACEGSSSIKNVLPVLAPGMNYNSLEIGKGDKAMRALCDLISNASPAHERDQIIHNLLLYCGMDTLAMVRIYEKLKLLSN